MIFSVRCHVSVMDGEALANVVITYDGERLPSELQPCDAVQGRVLTVCPFTGETHSTVDYNGISVIGMPPDDSIRMTYGNLRSVVGSLAAMTRMVRGEQPDIISFYRLG